MYNVFVRCSILNRKKNRKTKLIMVTTKNFLEIEIVLFHYATLKWWYEAREYTSFKGSKGKRLRSEGIIDWVRRGPSKGHPMVRADRGSKWNFYFNEGIFLCKKEDFFAESFLITSCSTLRRIQSSRKGKMEINPNVNSVLGYRTNVNLDSI